MFILITILQSSGLANCGMTGNPILSPSTPDTDLPEDASIFEQFEGWLQDSENSPSILNRAMNVITAFFTFGLIEVCGIPQVMSFFLSIITTLSLITIAYLIRGST